MKKIPSVTIGITAFNEENGIARILKSLLSQVESNFRLARILVISDGSNDNTVEEVLKIRDKRIELIQGKKRLGMNHRLNEIFSHLNTDILIKIDADVIPVSRNLISQLVEPFIKNTQVGYVSGKLIPVQPTTFVEEAANAGRYVWDQLRTYLDNGNGVYTCAGSIYALSRKFVKIASFPKDVWADIGYLYFQAKSHNFQFDYVESAQVYINPPTKIIDHINQITRYESESDKLYKYFPRDLLDQNYNIPKHILLKYKIKAFIKYPLPSIFLLLINLYARYVYKYKTKNSRSLWKVINSSKR